MELALSFQQLLLLPLLLPVHTFLPTYMFSLWVSEYLKSRMFQDPAGINF
jgi:hypothetical protein